MAGYAKLWSSITDSSLWSASKDAKILFVTLLAKADATGHVEAAPSGLARAANLTVAEVYAALLELTAPDPESKSKVAGGRRVAIVPRGYCLVNYEEHRDRAAEEERREYMRQYMREYRKGEPVNNSVTDGSKQDVNIGKQPLAKVSPSEASSSAASTSDPSGRGDAIASPPEQSSFKLAAPEQPTSSTPSAPDVADAIMHYQRRWVEVRQPDDGIPPKLQKADRGQLISMLKAYGPDGWRRHLERYLADCDRLVADNGWPLRLMSGRVDGYRAMATPSAKNGPLPPMAAATESKTELM